MTTAGGGSRDILTIRTLGCDWAMAGDDVEEVLPHRTAVRAPGSAPFVEGIVRYRDGVLPVVDLARRFRLPAGARPPAPPRPETRRTLVIRIPGGMAGLTVDEVLGSRAVRDDQLVPLPRLARSPVVRGCLVADQGEVLVVLDPRRILETDDPLDLPLPAGWGRMEETTSAQPGAPESPPAPPPRAATGRPEAAAPPPSARPAAPPPSPEPQAPRLAAPAAPPRPARETAGETPAGRTVSTPPPPAPEPAPPRAERGGPLGSARPAAPPPSPARSEVIAPPSSTRAEANAPPAPTRTEAIAPPAPRPAAPAAPSARPAEPPSRKADAAPVRPTATPPGSPGRPEAGAPSGTARPIAPPPFPGRQQAGAPPRTASVAPRDSADAPPGPPRRRAGRYIAAAAVLAVALGAGAFLATREPQRTESSPRAVATAPLPARSEAGAPPGSPARAQASVQHSSARTEDAAQPSSAARPGSGKLVLTLEERPAPGAAPAAPASDERLEIVEYTVVRGDTLWAIARRFTKNPFRYQEIASENDVKNPALIFPGQQLTLRIRRLEPTR